MNLSSPTKWLLQDKLRTSGANRSRRKGRNSGGSQNKYGGDLHGDGCYLVLGELGKIKTDDDGAASSKQQVAFLIVAMVR